MRELADDARATLRVHQVATPMERVAVARPDEPVVDLVARLGPRYGRRALVVDAGGDLVGIVTGSDLDRVLEVAAAVGAGAGLLTARQRRRPQGRRPLHPAAVRGDDQGMTATTIHQCPRCELRFANRSELEHHVRTDHLPVPGDDPPIPPPTGGVILVPVDPAAGPTPAVPLAAALARQTGLGVEIVAVPPVGLPVRPDLAARVQEGQAAGATRVHARTLAPTRGVARAIVDRARGPDVRLVCLATRDRSPVVQLLGGSVSGSVVRSSPVPVLIAGPAVRGAGESVRRVVACVDGSGLAERTLPVASGLARRLGAELVLVQVVPSRGPAQGGRAERAYLRRLADRLPYPARSEVIHGDPPATAIARYADQARARS